MAILLMLREASLVETSSETAAHGRSVDNAAVDCEDGPMRGGSPKFGRHYAEAHQAMSCLVVGQQVIVPKNLEHRPNELSLIVVTDLVGPHWLSSPIRS